MSRTTNQGKARRHLQRASQLLYGSSSHDNNFGVNLSSLFGGRRPQGGSGDTHQPDDTYDYGEQRALTHDLLRDIKPPRDVCWVFLVEWQRKRDAQGGTGLEGSLIAIHNIGHIIYYFPGEQVLDSWLETGQFMQCLYSRVQPPQSYDMKGQAPLLFLKQVHSAARQREHAVSQRKQQEQQKLVQVDNACMARRRRGLDRDLLIEIYHKAQALWGLWDVKYWFFSVDLMLEKTQSDVDRWSKRPHYNRIIHNDLIAVYKQSESDNMVHYCNVDIEGDVSPFPTAGFAAPYSNYVDFFDGFVEDLSPQENGYLRQIDDITDAKLASGRVIVSDRVISNVDVSPSPEELSKLELIVDLWDVRAFNDISAGMFCQICHDIPTQGVTCENETPHALCATCAIRFFMPYVAKKCPTCGVAIRPKRDLEPPYIRYHYELDRMDIVNYGILKLTRWDPDHSGPEPMYHAKIIMDRRKRLFEFDRVRLPLGSSRVFFGLTPFKPDDVTRMQEWFILNTNQDAMEKRKRTSDTNNDHADFTSEYPRPWIPFVYDKCLILGHTLLGNGLMRISEVSPNHVHLCVQYGAPKTSGMIVTLDKDQLYRFRADNFAEEQMIRVEKGAGHAGHPWHGYLSWRDLNSMITQTDKKRTHDQSMQSGVQPGTSKRRNSKNSDGGGEVVD